MGRHGDRYSNFCLRHPHPITGLHCQGGVTRSTVLYSTCYCIPYCVSHTTPIPQHRKQLYYILLLLLLLLLYSKVHAPQLKVPIHIPIHRLHPSPPSPPTRPIPPPCPNPSTIQPISLSGITSLGACKLFHHRLGQNSAPNKHTMPRTLKNTRDTGTCSTVSASKKREIGVTVGGMGVPRRDARG